MLLFCLCKDQDIVQVHYDDPFGYDGSEDLVHHGLEGGRTVGHSEEHHKRFEEAMVGTEGRLPFISRLDAYIIEAPADVEFCEVPGSVELGDEFKDKGERVSVLDSHSIQCAIILDQLEQTILLFNKEHRSCNGGFGRSDPSSTEVLLQEGIQLGLLQQGQGIDLCKRTLYACLDHTVGFA